MIVVDRLREHKIVLACQDVTVITSFVVLGRVSVIRAAGLVLFAFSHVIVATFFLVFAPRYVLIVTSS
jgi:magnesium-transporting ATPase (P-type)